MLRSRILAVKRETAGSYVDGIWQSGGTFEFTIRASVQPTSQNDMALLDTGRAYRQTFKLYSKKPLNKADQGANADVVVIDGREFEVVNTEPWQNGIISHHKTIVELRHAD